MKNDIKILISLITLFVVLFSGCLGNRYPDILIAADSISDTNPQRALSMLDSISAQMNNADEAVKSYYELLRIKASDKAYIPHKSDITILRLVDYYENGGDKSLLPVVYKADKILFMGNGSIIEQGTHDELCKMRGCYYKLVKNQIQLS